MAGSVPINLLLKEKTTDRKMAHQKNFNPLKLRLFSIAKEKLKLLSLLFSPFSRNS